jgi:hypothetical protein
VEVTIKESVQFDVNLKRVETFSVTLQANPTYAVEGEIVKTFTAGEDIAQGKVVYLGNDNKVYLCDNRQKEHAGRALGITTASATTDSTVPVQMVGELNTPYTLTQGEDYYIGINGDIVLQAGNSAVFVQRIGIALSDTKLFVNSAGFDALDVQINVAGENISGLSVVAFNSLGQLVHADHTNLDLADSVAGIVLHSVLSGEVCAYRNEGELEDPSWSWTTGSALFFDTNGVLTHTPQSSGFYCCVGYAKSPTVVSINIGEPIIL